VNKSKKLRTLIISEKLGENGEETSTVIALEAIARGHDVFECLPQAISFLNGKLYAEASRFEPKKNHNEESLILDEDFDIIHFRPNPPVDMAYLTLLYQLSLIEDKILIINRPSSIIKFAEKITPHFFADFSPPTLISHNEAKILEFIATHKQVVTKPLYEYSGYGVKKLNEETAQTELAQILANSEMPIVVQKFLPEITEGDKRILFVNFKYTEAFTRKPPDGSFLAGTVHGGETLKTELTARELEICKTLEPFLQKHDIYICGIDVIGDYVTEINITSPGGFNYVDKLYGKKPEIELWDKIEEELNV